MLGSAEKMDPRPNHAETSYKGSGRLKDKRAIITGGSNKTVTPLSKTSTT
jgi:hypothetical protein